jgi:hypothetical protein
MRHWREAEAYLETRWGLPLGRRTIILEKALAA